MTAVRVLTVQGEEGLASAGRLRARVHEALAERPHVLVVDLTACGLVDAGALTVLLDAHRSLLRVGGRLVLRGVSERVERVLALTGLHGVFDVEA